MKLGSLSARTLGGAYSTAEEAAERDLRIQRAATITAQRESVTAQRMALNGAISAVAAALANSEASLLPELVAALERLVRANATLAGLEERVLGVVPLLPQPVATQWEGLTDQERARRIAFSVARSVQLLQAGARPATGDDEEPPG